MGFGELLVIFLKVCEFFCFFVEIYRFLLGLFRFVVAFLVIFFDLQPYYLGPLGIILFFGG